MRLIFISLILFVGLSFLVACGGAAAPSPTPEQSNINVLLTTNPDPPKSGDVELIVTVNDTSGQPIPDAEVFIFADHTEMNGMSMNGRATAQGSGRYAITAGFEHGGNWKVTVQVKKAPLDEVQEFSLELQ